MTSLSISSPSELESLVTKAIYSSLITARLSPATNPPTVHVTSVAPLRDVRPQSVAAMITILTEWESRCGGVIGGIEAEISRIKAEAERRRAKERARAELVERTLNGWEGDDDLGGESGGRRGGLRSKESKHGFSGGAGPGNKREFNADHDDDDGYWDNGSDGAADSGAAGSRMDIDEGAGSSRTGASAGTGARQAKRILNMGKKS